MLPVRLLDVTDLMERSFPEDASSDGIHFDRPRGAEWLNNVFQRHMCTLEADLLETAHSHSVFPHTSFLYHKVPIHSPGSESRLKRQIEEQPDEATGFHADGSRGSGVVHAQKFGGIISIGGYQESGKTNEDEPYTISREDKGIGPGRSGMQTGVGGGPGAQARFT